MVEEFDIDVYMHNIRNGDNYNDTFTVCGTELIADLMIRVVNRYNAKRYCTVYLHPDSPYILSADGSRYPPHGSIVNVIRTCEDLQEHMRQEKPRNLIVRLHARLIPTNKRKGVFS